MSDGQDNAPRFDDAKALDDIAANMEAANLRNTADAIRVIAGRVRRMRATIDAVYAETMEDIEIVEKMMERRRCAVASGEVAMLRPGGGR